jgi:hypothetical protein
MAQYYRLDVTLDAKSFAVGALSNYQLDVTLDAESLAVGVLSTKRVEVSLPQVGPQGPQGETGATGPANELTIGSVTTGAPGTQADATLTGEAPNQTLNLAIPRGDQGEVGPPGETGQQGIAGPANTLAIGTVTTGAAGSSADATITGDSPAQTLNLVIPRGDKGDQGDQGPPGTATTDAADLTTGTLADARLSTNVPLLDAANTYSANQTLDGTNNVAPNQTAASDSSLMTRSLVDARTLEQSNRSIVITNFTGSTTGTSGGSVAFNPGVMQLRSNSGAGNYAAAHARWYVAQLPAGLLAVDFTKTLEFEFYAIFAGDTRSTAMLAPIASNAPVFVTGHAPGILNARIPFFQLRNDSLHAVSGRYLRVSGALSRTSNVVTVNTNGNHNLTTGDFVVVGNVNPATFTVPRAEVTVTSATQFTYARDGADGNSTTTGDGINIYQMTDIGTPEVIASTSNAFTGTTNARLLKIRLSNGTAEWFINSGSGYALVGTDTGMVASLFSNASGSIFGVQNSAATTAITDLWISNLRISYV